MKNVYCQFIQRENQKHLAFENLVWVNVCIIIFHLKTDKLFKNSTLPLFVHDVEAVKAISELILILIHIYVTI